MAPRTSATFAKRQKDRARQEKQEIKQQRRLQRKQEKLNALQLSKSGEPDPNNEDPSHSATLSGTCMADTATAPTEKELQ